MGYTIVIGEMETENDLMYNTIQITAKLHRLENAPAFGEPTDCENQRWPSYTAWSDFCDFVGLRRLFYDDDMGLFRPHPGAAPLHVGIKKQIDKAYDDFMEKYPGTTPAFNHENDPDFPDEKYQLCRLEWLKFWVDWALENCKNPIITNSIMAKNRIPEIETCQKQKP